MFVVFEGISGSGKTKHIDHFIKHLKKDGKRVKLYVYPDLKGPYKIILGLFLKKELRLDPTTQMMTFLADMAKDQEQIEKDLKKGYWVIVDRYVFTAIAYHNLPLKKAKEIVESMHMKKPDLICRVTIMPDVAMERMAKKRRYNKYEKDREHVLRAHLRYSQMAEDNFISKWVTVHTTKPEEEVKEEIKRLILKK